MLKCKNIKFKNIYLFNNKKGDRNKNDYVAEKRMGFTPYIQENQGKIGFITVGSFNKNNFIFNDENIEIFTDETEFNRHGKDSEKRKYIENDEIIVSFKQTIGLVNIFKAKIPCITSEAVDVLTIDKEKYDNKFIAYQLSNIYKNNSKQNSGSKTLNDDIKETLTIKIPDSLKIQQSIAPYIEEQYQEIERKKSLLDSLIHLKNREKEVILNDVFEKNKLQNQPLPINPSKYLLKAKEDNNYFKTINGSRITKAKLHDTEEENDIIVFSASEFDNEIFGYINKDELKKNKPRFKGTTIFLNTGGSVGKVRIKNIEKEYTCIDNVLIIEPKKNTEYISPLYYKGFIDYKLKNISLSFSNTIRGEDLEKQNIEIPIYDKATMVKISNYIETEYNRIDLQISKLESMKHILDRQKEVILDEIFGEK